MWVEKFYSETYPLVRGIMYVSACAHIPGLQWVGDSDKAIDVSFVEAKELADGEFECIASLK